MSVSPNSYVDVAAIVQIIGCVFNQPSLLDDTDKYSIHEEDFVNEFHKVVFGSILNIHLMGNGVSLDAIVDYLAGRPKYKGIFEANSGVDYLIQASKIATLDTFNYYYSRLKKMSLLRAYTSFGLDVSDLYDPSEVLDVKKRQSQEEWLDSTSLIDIANLIESKIDEIRSNFVDDDDGESYQAGDGAENLIYELEERPEVGIPLYGPLINTITRGARLCKLYLRSGATGAGKTRSMIADACYFACPRIYSEWGWVKCGMPQPTLFISTELELKEIQTMMLAFLSNVNEEHILDGQYLEGERERVIEAARILKESPLWVEILPDFSLEDIENTIKKYIREHDVKYVVYDYIHTSMKILEEITRRSGGIKLREDNVLFMLSTRLKDLCNKYGIFIMTGTQLNGTYQDAETPDQNLLRGAKSIADELTSSLVEILSDYQEENCWKLLRAS